MDSLYQNINVTKSKVSDPVHKNQKKKFYAHGPRTCLQLLHVVHRAAFLFHVMYSGMGIKRNTDREKER